MTLLTIAIPTHNRSSHLDFLLSVIETEVNTLQGIVVVHVLDNASTDETSAVLAKYHAKILWLTSQRNCKNLGADSNIKACFQKANTPYVWILGDDDAPFKGSLLRLVKLLEQQRPDMVYLPSIGSRSINKDYIFKELGSFRVVTLSRERFAAIVNVQLTFISGLVLRKDAASPDSITAALEVTNGTSLIQLAWVYEILRQGKRFFVFRNEMLMTTAGNTGGYAVLDVFLVNHTNLACQLLASEPKVLRAILRRTSLCYLPGLIWNVRIGRAGSFDMPHRAFVQVPKELSGLLSFSFLVLPIWTFQMVWARLFFQISRVITRMLRLYDCIAL